MEATSVTTSETVDPEGAEPVESDGGARPGPEHRGRPTVPDAMYVLAIYGASRLILLVGDLYAAHIDYHGRLTGPLLSWDSHWYLQTARTFYPPHPAIRSLIFGGVTYGTAGFEPGFPALIRAGMVLGLTPMQSALGVSVISGAIGTILVWRLGAALYDEEVGRISAVLFAFFPGMAVAWGLLYSECLGVTLVAASLLLMHRERWVWAGFVGALATVTSPIALPLVLAPLVVVPRYWKKDDVGPILAAVQIPLGFVAFAYYLGVRYHDPLFWWRQQQQGWGAAIDFGRSLLHLLWNPLAAGPEGRGWLEWIGVVAVVLALYALRRMSCPLYVSIYCVGIFVMSFVSNQLGFKPRMLVWAFPALIAVAAMTRRKGWLVIALVFAGLLPYVFLLYSTNGNYIVAP